MKQIIPPVDRQLILAELTPEKFIRNTNKGNNQIFLITAHDSPNVMREIGRVRELSFRVSGGGTGEEIDTDEFDYMEKPYKQLIVWNPQDQEIIGGYRFIHARDMKMGENGQPLIVTEHMFHFSDEFLKDYFPKTLDLGRAFVHPDYQSTKTHAKSIFAFDNLWDGLLVIPFFEPDTEYIIGKITIYPEYDELARTAIFYFLNHFLGDEKGLLVCKDPVFDQNTEPSAEIKEIFNGKDLDENYNNLLQYIRKRGVNIPPLINSYFKLSSQMKVFGTGINREFGDIYDTGSMICASQINQDKVARHIDSFLRDKAAREAQGQ